MIDFRIPNTIFVLSKFIEAGKAEVGGRKTEVGGRMLRMEERIFLAQLYCGVMKP